MAGQVGGCSGTSTGYPLSVGVHAVAGCDVSNWRLQLTAFGARSFAFWRHRVRRASAAAEAQAVGRRIRSGHTVEQPVNLLDTAPTLARLLDFAPHRDWEGRCVAEICEAGMSQ